MMVQELRRRSRSGSTYHHSHILNDQLQEFVPSVTAMLGLSGL